MFKFDESMYGKKVRFINAKAHEEMPEYYPEVGIIGILVSVKGTDEMALLCAVSIKLTGREDATEWMWKLVGGEN